MFNMREGPKLKHKKTQNASYWCDRYKKRVKENDSRGHFTINFIYFVIISKELWQTRG